MTPMQKERRKARQSLQRQIKADCKRKGYRVAKPGIIKGLAFTKVQEVVKLFEGAVITGQRGGGKTAAMEDALAKAEAEGAKVIRA